MLQLGNSGIEIKYQRGLKQDCSSRVEAKSRFTRNIKGPFLDKLLTNINDRFVDSDVLGAFSIFKPDKLNIQEKDYGNNNIKLLTERFGVFPTDQALIEWNIFKQFFHDTLLTLTEQQVLDRLCFNKDNLKTVFPIMSFMASCYRVLPPHTADCERDFSQMKIIKTYLRNRMCETTLDGIMRIVIEGPIIAEFPFEKVVRMWAQRKHRRLKLD